MRCRITNEQSSHWQRLHAIVLGVLFTLLYLPLTAQALDKAHHTENGFINPQEHEQTTFSDFLKWRWNRSPDQSKNYQFVVRKPDVKDLRNPAANNQVTWIGHATVLLQTEGINILTDPQFSERASPVQWLGPQRVVPPALRIEQLPPVDYVLISHNHYDSLDTDSVKALHARPNGDKTVFVVPLKLKAWFANEGISNVVELDWWQKKQFKNITITAVPAQHWSKRSMIGQNQTLWAGFVVTSPSLNFYFAGDTGYYQPMFLEIGEKLGPFDLAAIPIGAYEPRWFMKSKHINPDESVKVHRDIQASKSIAIHWGTFPLTDEPLDEPPLKLWKALDKYEVPEDAFVVMQHGETMRIK
jgi:L-ascorbate metabolism protein UlaG (beta-lactamase superfamily)